ERKHDEKPAPRTNETREPSDNNTNEEHSHQRDRTRSHHAFRTSSQHRERDHQHHRRETAKQPVLRNEHRELTPQKSAEHRTSSDNTTHPSANASLARSKHCTHSACCSHEQE